MNNILVPTDFSKNAENALQYAINLGNKFGSKIFLLHTFKVPSKTGMLISIEKFMRDDAEQKLSELVKKYKTALFHDTSMEALAIKGNAIKIITAFANQHAVDLVVMGTQGASGLKEIFIGSNTVGVIKNVKQPLMAIPQDFKYRPFNKIVLALDELSVSTNKQLQPLTQLAKSYRSKIEVYHIADQPVEAGADPSIDIYLDGLEYSFHQESGIDNINKGIENFVEATKADLLCIIRKSRGFLQEVFHSSVTKASAFHSTVPLLILQEVE